VVRKLSACQNGMHSLPEFIGLTQDLLRATTDRSGLRAPNRSSVRNRAAHRLVAGGLPGQRLLARLSIATSNEKRHYFVFVISRCCSCEHPPTSFRTEPPSGYVAPIVFTNGSRGDLIENGSEVGERCD
jgi:hypothetical protein